MRWMWASIAAIGVLLAASPGPAGDGAARQHKFVGPGKCATCHKKKPIGNQQAVWLESKHAKAFETLASEQARKWAAEAGIGDPQTDERCFKCHVTGHGVPESLLGLKYKHSDGVTCEACHGAGAGYRKKKVMMDRDLAVKKGLVLQSEAVCLGCHNDESPAWDPQRYTRPDGTKVGFDYEQAVRAIAHPVPEDYDPTAEGEAD